ncbi:nicotianamine synthase [Dissoconium aciculare CBS 342.82]|uniref:Nicotianamine synthase n=1 Tax=Dissoconium aciculare CBS 342.82 TaxID=1314786 RepID=A0A6J3MIQ8_9PEZI|nr:nicotianamine synthase [Dissoconium aciculare CBS 342.82]KAF1826797.1 nicotianamine synthase [Dissoconium aciculare CBS 342.82]
MSTSSEAPIQYLVKHDNSNTTDAVTGTVSRKALELPTHESRTERIILGVLALFEAISNLPSLEPNPDNAGLFNQLFDLVTITKTTLTEEETILNDPRITAIVLPLWKTWGLGEYMLERDFAHQILAGSSPAAAFQIYNSFPYIDQYRQLARMEANTIDTALGELQLPPVKKMAFLGSGPTPFSSLCFAERLGPDVQLVNVDRNPEAIKLGSAIVSRCGFKNISHTQADVATLSEELQSCDIVHFAALIGDTAQEKRDLLISVAKNMRPGSLILLRSTDALRSLLYPRIDVEEDEILKLVTPIVATRYYGAATSLTAIIVCVDGVKKN